MGVIVKQKKKGRGQPWWVFIHVNGVRRTKKVGDRHTAEAIASGIRRRFKAGELGIDDLGKPKSPEFTDYAAHYLETYAKTTCKRNTWAGYESMIEKHLNPVFKGKRLNGITRAEVKRFLLQKQRDGLAVSTVDNIRVLLSGIFTHAYEDGVVTENPVLRLGKILTKQDHRRSARPLSREAVGQILSVAHEQYPLHHAFLLAAFRTGMRLGELIGLAWSDLDFDACSIDVRRSYSHGHWSLPKSNKSRTVDMSDQLRTVLLEHREDLIVRFGGEPPAFRVGQKNVRTDTLVQLVFPNRRGGPMCGDNFRARVFRKLFEAADVPAFRFHDIRHTFASLLLAQGEPLHYVKEQLGHASITTTVDVYGHLVPSSNRNAVNRLDDSATPSVRLAGADSA